MSAVEKLANYEQEMMQEVQHVQEMMLKTASGQKMMESSMSMAGTEEMGALMALMGKEEVREEERMLLAQYMGDMLKQNPLNGMLLFSEYLRNVAGDPKYSARREYYLEMANAATAVHETTEYQDYIVTYNAFENDNSPDAVAARQATQEMQAKMRQWAEIE